MLIADDSPRGRSGSLFLRMGLTFPPPQRHPTLPLADCSGSTAACGTSPRFHDLDGVPRDFYIYCSGRQIQTRMIHEPDFTG
jgi:hypothetical protein